MGPNSAARRIQRAFRAKRIAFTNNAGTFRLSRPRVMSRTVNVKLSGEPIFVWPTRLPTGVKSLEGRTRLGQPPSYRATETTFTGTPEGVKHWYFTFKSGGSCIYHEISKTLQIVTKGETMFEPVMRRAIATFISGSPKVDSIKTTNIDGIMYTDRFIDIDAIRGGVIPFELGGHEEGSRELFGSGRIVKWKSPKVTLIVFRSKKILIKGTSDLSRGPIAFKKLAEVFGEGLFEGGQTNAAAPTSTQMRGQKYSARINARYPLGHVTNYSFQRNNVNPFSIRSGYYIRPGPNGQPRFYKIPENPRLVVPKVVAAYANAGIRIPPFVKTALGIRNNVPSAQNQGGPERAPNWTATKPGYYVKPGPGRLPYFYKVPKGKAAARKTVVKAYANASVRIPTPVRTIFGIENTNSPRFGQHSIRAEKINGRHYSRFTRDQLLQIARNMNVATVGPSNSLATIFGAIKAAYGTPSPNRRIGPNFTYKGVQYKLLNNGRVNRNGRPRMFNTLKKNERLEIARGFIGSGPRLNHLASLPTKNWYKTLLTIKNLRTRGLASPRKATPTSRRSTPSSSPNVVFHMP